MSFEKEYKRIDLILWNRCKRLEKRLKVAEDRAERLAQASRDYETATENPTPEEEARLERIMRAMNHADRVFQDIEHRVELLNKMLSLAEDEQTLALRPKDRSYTVS